MLVERGTRGSAQIAQCSHPRDLLLKWWSSNALMSIALQLCLDIYNPYKGINSMNLQHIQSLFFEPDHDFAGDECCKGEPHVLQKGRRAQTHEPMTPSAESLGHVFYLLKEACHGKISSRKTQATRTTLQSSFADLVGWRPSLVG